MQIDTSLNDKVRIYFEHLLNYLIGLLFQIVHILYNVKFEGFIVSLCLEEVRFYAFV